MNIPKSATDLAGSEAGLYFVDAPTMDASASVSCPVFSSAASGDGQNMAPSPDIEEMRPNATAVQSC